MRSKGLYGSGPRGKATRLHSQIVRARGACENCGRTDQLQCAHIIARRYSATRTDEKNAFCLCARCHMRMTMFADEWMAFVEAKIGRAEYDRLKAKALAVTKVDWTAEAERLAAVWKKIIESELVA